MDRVQRTGSKPRKDAPHCTHVQKDSSCARVSLMAHPAVVLAPKSMVVWDVGEQLPSSKLPYVQGNGTGMAEL